MNLARNTDIDTSHAAAASVEAQLTNLQSDVLDAFIQHGSLTDLRLNELFKDRGYAESTVRKRRSELAELGYVKDSGNRVGRHAVWELA